MFSKVKLHVILSLVFLLFSVHLATANPAAIQLNNDDSYTIKGKIIDADSGESIPFCSVILENSYSGTSSNEDGEFLINIDIFPIKLIFSHLNYKKQIVTVTKEAELLIKLSPLAHSLEEVILEFEGNDNYAIELAQKAFEKMTELSTIQKYGKALYRQKAKNGNTYSEFSEIIYDIAYNATGIEEWEIIEGRYALKENSVNNKNFTLFSRLLKSLQPNTDDLIFPLRQSLENFYNVKISDVLNTGGGKIIVLHFEPKKERSTPAFKGDIYVNSSSYEVLKVIGSLANDDLDLVKLTGKDSYKKNYVLSYEMTFKKEANLNLVLDYININQSFDYYKGSVRRTHVSTNSNLFFFEYHQPTGNRRLGNQFSRKTSDWENLNDIGYNEKFWKENQIVKRTPIEQEVIDAFEKGNKFESMFLNSRQQIALMQSGISADPFITWLGESMRLFSKNNPIQKVYLHTSKDLFFSGDDLWYSAYGVIGSSHNVSLENQVLHIDLINDKNKIVITQQIDLKEGRGRGVIKIDPNMLPGVYQLRAYTNWMRNFDEALFFNKKIEIVSQVRNNPPLNRDANIDLQFFPEGGDAIAGLMNSIAFKAIGSDGLGTKVKGRIINSKGENVAKIQSIFNGAGSFRLTPKHGESYTAVLENNSEYSLPSIKNSGYVMRIDNRNSKTVRIRIQASEDLKDKPFYVVGHIRGKKYYQGRFEFNDAELINFEIPKNKLLSGIMTLTLFDQDKKPWAERILFINNQYELTIRTKLNKKTFKSKDKIVLDINVTDPFGRAVTSEFSVAITDADIVQKNANASNILTHLLLQSELKGVVENPGLHFKDQKASTRSRLDLVMLTNGWRRFNWENLDEQKNDSIKKYSFDEKYSISGIARNMKNEVLSNTRLRIITKTSDRFKFKMDTTTTNANGRFVVNTLNYSDSLSLVFSAYSRKNKPIGVQIELDKTTNKFSAVPNSNFQGSKRAKTKKQIQLEDKIRQHGQLEQRNSREQNALTNSVRSEKLDEVNIKATVDQRRSSVTASKYGISPDEVIYVDELPKENNFISLLNGVSGIRIKGAGRNIAVQVRNLNTPLWILDGVPVAHEIDESVPTLTDDGTVIQTAVFKSVKTVPQVIFDLNPADIDKIEVYKGPSAASFGPRGAGGVILVSTKKAGSSYIKVASSELNINAYSEVKEFYLPKYEIDPKTRAQRDYRTTLYWNPLLKTDANGNATVIFFNSDRAKNFQIAIEGLSNYGIPGVLLKAVGD